MEYSDYVAAADRDLAALCAAVAAGPVDDQVPTCPEFDVDGLARHVAAFCTRWTEVVRERRMVPFRPITPDGTATDGTATDSGSRAAWLAGIGDELLDLLRTTPPDTACWSWYPQDQTAGFIARRVANELCMHRVDAQLARGGAGPIEPALAVNGIDEIFLILEHHSRFKGESIRGSGRTLHLHGTDTHPGVGRAEWMVTFSPGSVEVTHEHGKGDLALRGAAGDLERLLYQRPTDEPVESFGDPTVLDEFHGAFAF